MLIIYEQQSKWENSSVYTNRKQDEKQCDDDDGIAGKQNLGCRKSNAMTRKE